MGQFTPGTQIKETLPSGEEVVWEVTSMDENGLLTNHIAGYELKNIVLHLRRDIPAQRPVSNQSWNEGGYDPAPSDAEMPDWRKEQMSDDGDNDSRTDYDRMP